MTVKDGTLVAASDPVKKEITFNLKKYRLLIPEVSAGVIWAKQDYRDFATTTDDFGQTRVGQEEGSAIYERFAITTMINLNFNVPNSPVLPFIQFGAGLNGEAPMGLLGGGLRIDNLGEFKLGLSMGASFTGIQELSTLNLGDVVTDQLEIENDLEYKFSGPKLYFGIQYDF